MFVVHKFVVHKRRSQQKLFYSKYYAVSDRREGLTCNPGKTALLGRYGIKDTNHATFSADNLVSLESINSCGGSNALKYLVISTDLPVTSATKGLT